MNYTALSLSQAPPLSVPLRFFLTAPLFLAGAALLLFAMPESVGHGRWSPTVLALTHLVTLGFLGMVMVGAVQQLLPVLIGVPLRHPRPISLLLHLLMTLGIALLVTGMAVSQPLWLQWGIGFLLPALLLFVVLTGRALWRSPSSHATVGAMFVALLGLLTLAGIALWLLRSGDWHLPLAHPLTRLHIGWGGLGWIAALLIGVAYQVVPMFQITPDYPIRLRRWLVPSLGLLLFCWTGLYLLFPALAVWLEMALGLLLVLFAVQTLQLQQRRKRRLADVTLDFWRLAMVCLPLSVALWATGRWISWPPLDLLMGLVFLLGFAVSAVNGMLYKIVPFLVWLHLNNRLQRQGSWQGSVPNMKQIIPVAAMRWQFRLHLLVLILLLVAVVLGTPALLRVASLAWLGSALYLGWNLLQGVSCYRRCLRQATQN